MVRCEVVNGHSHNWAVFAQFAPPWAEHVLSTGRWQVQHFHAFEVPHDASQNATFSRNFRKPGTVVGVALLDCCVLEPNLRVVMV